MTAMKGSASLFLTLAMLGSIALIFLLRVFTSFSSSAPEPFLPATGVRGMAIFYQGLPYTLNWEQQGQCLQSLNRSLPIAKSPAPETQPFNVEALTVYLFNQPDLVLHIVGQRNGNLLFSAPSWSRDQLLLDVSDGGLLRLLSSCHDP